MNVVHERELHVLHLQLRWLTCFGRQHECKGYRCGRCPLDVPAHRSLRYEPGLLDSRAQPLPK